MKLLFLNGVNLNLTGRREKGVYGAETLDDINAQIRSYVNARGAECEFYQSNIEGEICAKLHATDADGVILNAGAPITVMPSATRSRAYPCPSSRCICPTCTRGKSSAILPCSARYAAAVFSDSEKTVIF